MNYYSVVVLCLALVFSSVQCQNTAVSASSSSSSVSSTDGNVAQAQSLTTQTGPEGKVEKQVARDFETDETFPCSPSLQKFLDTSKPDFLVAEDPCANLNEKPTPPPCRVSADQKFKVQTMKRIVSLKTPSPAVCCELCQALSACKSYWRRESDKVCSLNSISTTGAPSTYASGGSF